MMMIYIHEHYTEKITISDLASTAYLSERECFRIFRNYLHTTPTEYIRSLSPKRSVQITLHIATIRSPKLDFPAD